MLRGVLCFYENENSKYLDNFVNESGNMADQLKYMERKEVSVVREANKICCQKKVGRYEFEAKHGVALILLGRILIKSGKPEEANKYLNQAKTIFSKLIRKQHGNAQFSNELEKVLRLLQQLEN